MSRLQTVVSEPGIGLPENKALRTGLAEHSLNVL